MQPLSGCDGVLPFRARRPIIVNGEMVLDASTNIMIIPTGLPINSHRFQPVVKDTNIPTTLKWVERRRR